MSDIQIYAEGKAFESGVYDLRTLELLISNYRKILDQLIVIRSGQIKSAKASASGVTYKTKIENGSIQFLIELLIENREVIAASMIAADQSAGAQIASSIMSLFEKAMDLRKAAADFVARGLSFEININNSFNSSSKTYSNNSKNYIFIDSVETLLAAQKTRGNVNNLVRSIDGENLQTVSLGSEDRINRFNIESRSLLADGRELLETTLTIIGRLDMVSISGHKGAIVSDGNRYPVTWDERIRSAMKSVIDQDGVMFRVRPVVDKQRLSNEAISFHVLDCDY